MAFIIVNATSKKAEELLRKWSKPLQKIRTSAKKYFIRKMGPGTYLMEANAAVLALLYDLKRRHDGNIYVYAAKPLAVKPEFPKEVVEVVELCQKEERNLLERDLKPLEKIEIDCSVSWKRSSSA